MRNDIDKVVINRDWKFKEAFPTISAYTTTFNCVRGKYPIAAAVRSFAWADEVIVVDGGSTDGTLEALQALRAELPNLVVHSMPVDLSDPGKDGALKAISRALCSNEFLVQFDADEIAVGDPSAWKRVAKLMPSSVDIVELFVAEPFGELNNLRLNPEHNPLKWRMSRNKAEISHGIPANDRVEKDGKVYSKGGSDGCYPIHIVDNHLYPSAFSPALAALARAKNGDPDVYVQLVQKYTEAHPYVLHLGHVDLKSKIALYLSSWHDWWCDLYGKNPADPQNNLYFPGVSISDVTDEMIEAKVEELKRLTPVVSWTQSYVSQHGSL